MRIFFGRQFPGFKCERFRRHISSNIMRLKYQQFLIIIAKYHRSLWLFYRTSDVIKRQIVKQKLSWAKQVWWEPSVLKHNKLKIKIGENKKSINENYLYLFIPHLLVPYWLYLKLAVFYGLANKYPYKYPIKCWNFERHWSEELNLS